MVETIAALGRNEVDVVQVFEPYDEELVASGTCQIWYAAASRGATSYTTFYARKPLIAARRTECLAMVRAVQRTLKWVHAASAAAFAEAIAAHFPDIDKAGLAACLRVTRRAASGARIAGRPRLVMSGWSIASRPAALPSGVPFAIAVDSSLADEVLRTDPAPLVP